MPSGASADESRRPLGTPLGSPRRGLWRSQEPPGAPAAPEAALRAPGLALRSPQLPGGDDPRFTKEEAPRAGLEPWAAVAARPPAAGVGHPGQGRGHLTPKAGKRHDRSRPQSRLGKNSQVCGYQKQAADADGEEGSPAHPRATFRPAWGAESRGHSQGCLARVPAPARRVVISAARLGPHGP